MCVKRLIEDLTKASHSQTFASGSLQDAIGDAKPVVALQLCELLRRSAELQASIDALLEAVRNEN